MTVVTYLKARTFKKQNKNLLSSNMKFGHTRKIKNYSRFFAIVITCGGIPSVMHDHSLLKRYNSVIRDQEI